MGKYIPENIRNKKYNDLLKKYQYQLVVNKKQALLIERLDNSYQDCIHSTVDKGKPKK